VLQLGAVGDYFDSLAATIDRMPTGDAAAAAARAYGQEDEEAASAAH